MQKNFRHTKDVLKYSAVYKKRKKARSMKLVFLLILFVCFLIGLIFIIRTPTFTISEIQVKDLQSANTQDIVNEIDSKIGGSYALVLPKKNIFFYPKNKIRNDLLNKFSTFGDVQLKIIDTNKLEVTIIEKSATAVSCKTEQSIVDNSFADCFFIDSDTRAFQAVTGEPDQSLDKYVDFNVNTASSTLSSSIIKQLQKIKTDLNVRNLITHFIKIVDSKSAEFQIVDNGKIKIPIPFADDFISIFDTALSTSLVSSSIKFEYIDARFGNKVFFKAKDIFDIKKLSNKATSTSSFASTSTSTMVMFKNRDTKTKVDTLNTTAVKVVNKKLKATTTVYQVKKI